MIDQKGEIRNFLRIFHDLSVSLMNEHPPDHLYHEIGVSGEKTVIVKGYESASLIHELTGWHVLMTYRSESLMKVAVRLRADFRDRAILVAGESRLNQIPKFRILHEVLQRRREQKLQCRFSEVSAEIRYEFPSSQFRRAEICHILRTGETTLFRNYPERPKSRAENPNGKIRG